MDGSDGEGGAVLILCPPPPGQDPNPAGLGTGAVMSIVLALVLLGVLLVTCGPLAYKKLVKKCGCRCPLPPPLKALGGGTGRVPPLFHPPLPLPPLPTPSPFLTGLFLPKVANSVRNVVAADAPKWVPAEPTPGQVWAWLFFRG